jgi:hypothetical protein
MGGGSFKINSLKAVQSRRERHEERGTQYRRQYNANESDAGTSKQDWQHISTNELLGAQPQYLQDDVVAG